MELDYRAIGKRIKIARIQANLKQEKLAEIINVSPTHLSNIETGTTRVSLQTLVRIANALSVRLMICFATALSVRLRKFRLIWPICFRIVTIMKSGSSQT